MTPLMADPRRETDLTLALLDRWLHQLENTTSEVRVEIARIAQEGRGVDAPADPDRER